jgi:DNA-binding CsgD family transcriptional regulator
VSWNTLEPHIRAQLTQRLSPRQHDVLILWLAGCSYTQISEMLNIQPRTVRTHLHSAKIIYQQIRQEAA